MVILAGLVPLAAGPAQATTPQGRDFCDLPPGLVLLYQSVEQAAFASTAPDPDLRRALGSAQAVVSGWMATRATGAPALPAGISDLLREARALADRGDMLDRFRARQVVDAFGAASAEYCTRHTKATDGSATGTARFLPDGMTRGGTGSGDGADTGAVPRPMDAALLLVLSLLGVGMVLGLRWLVDLYRAFRLRRRNCRIPAQLHIDGFTVFGHITILGRRGCRFQAESTQGHDAICRLAETGETELTSAGLVIPAITDRLDEDSCVVYFELPLPTGFQTRLLHASVRSPTFNARMPRAPSNVDRLDRKRAPRGAHEESPANVRLPVGQAAATGRGAP